MEEVTLRKYAALLVKAGGNVQQGQPVIITCSVDDAYFARLVEEYAYQAGASEVVIDWFDDLSDRMRYLHADNALFDEYPDWRVQRYKYYDDRGVVYLHIRSTDPDLLSGIDPDRIKRNTRATRTAIKAHTALTMSNALRWSLLAVPSVKWAKKVFPHLADAEAVDALWRYILKGARADGADPISDWQEHKRHFEKRVGWLNEQAFSALRFTNSLGTDLTVGLAKNHIWCGGGDIGQDGVYFFPNMPTEEIFTAPDRNRTNGRVVASMPLSYHGNLIEGFAFTFKDGRVVSYEAQKNKEVLGNIVEMDEGSHYLGEVALVDNNSPIAKMQTLFYETLFDENASCHLALGKAYPDNVKGGLKMTDEERLAIGVNDSLMHVDFMFGTPDMKITGIYEDGRETVFFNNGVFC